MITNEGGFMKNIQKGFTLIELMIVVAIIGILAAVAIPAYQDYVIKAKLSKVQSTVDPIKLALAMFYQENGSFPGGGTATSATQVTTANQNTTSDLFYTSLGLGTYPTLPVEVASMDLSNAATTPQTALITLTIKAGAIKAGTCAAAGATPTASAGIDGCTVIMTGTANSTAITWTYSGTALGNTIAAGYFK
jgi:type IV pilus assembly protein PilA